MGSSSSDYFHWDNEPHLTFSGLARLCRHVLLNFVQRQPALQKEDYPEWRHEIPGLMTGRLSPELWIGRTESFRPEFINHRFSGFTEHLAQKLTVSPLQLADLRPLLETIERHIPQAKQADRNVMVCFYWLCHNLVHKNYHRPRWQELIEKHKKAIDDCLIQVLASLVVLNVEFSWPVTECESEFNLYLRRKPKPKAIRLPTIIEVAVMSEIANMWLRDGDSMQFTEWIDRAILDAAGRQSVQAYLQQCKEDESEVCKQIVLGVPPRCELPDEDWLQWL